MPVSRVHSLASALVLGALFALWSLLPVVADAATSSYLQPDQIDALLLLPAPPAADSEAQRQDLQAVLTQQRMARAAGTTAQAIADAHLDCDRFADAVGAQLQGAAAATALAFLNRAAHEGAAVTGPAKRYWHRARPYVVSSEVARLGDMATAPLRLGRGDYSSFPSGHAAFAAVCALILADMVPEQRQAISAREQTYENSRMVLGAHFPDDLRAGRIAGTLAVAAMFNNAGFRRDLGVARASLRAALGLAAATDDATDSGGRVRR